MQVPLVSRHFLHPQVLVTREELFDLLCSRLNMAKSRASYTIFQELEWSFGQQLIRQDGRVFWATDNQYPFGSAGRRRDILRIHGTETVGPSVNALCCEAVVFITITNIHLLPGYTAADLVSDRLTFVLGRWFSPHTSTHANRDSNNLPVCPGALNINHCLWTYARTTRPRSTILKRDGTMSTNCSVQRDMFGHTVRQQILKIQLDSHAYFCLLDVDNVSHTVNMCPQFVGASSTHDYTSWLETITLN